MTVKTYEIRTDTQDMQALRTAVHNGAFAETFRMLRVQLEHNRGSQAGDAVEREITHLEHGIACLMAARPTT
jgi:hypothetical protein